MNFARLSVLSASILIAACGGSGELFGGTQPSGNTLAITSTNATTVTRVSWEAVVASGAFGDLGLSASAPGGVAKGGATVQAASRVVEVTHQVPIGPEVTDCLVRGTVTISGDVADPLTLSIGDTFSVVSEQCDDGAGEVVDGTIDFTVGDFSGDLLTGAYLLSMDAAITALQIATSTDTVTSNGDVTVSLDTIDAPFVEAGVSGTSMTVDSNASSETLSNYASSNTVDGGLESLPYTTSASGTLDSTELDGVIQYSTPVTFAGEGIDYPSSGALLVEGAGSSVRLTAVDNVNVTIEIDVNGDGQINETINTTWAELTAS